MQDGYGNDVPMETQERFPQGMWKSRTDREISTFPQADHPLWKTEQSEDQTAVVS